MVMDVRNGEVLALGQLAVVRPEPVRARDQPVRLRAPAAPRRTARRSTNRAIQGLYPTGSTFKLVTATAALEEGLITPTESQFDGGSLEVGGMTFQNAGGASYGSLALRKALPVSSDVFFYRLGLEADGAGDGLAIQRWARRLGLGPRDRHRPARRAPRPHPDARVAQPAVHART